VLLLQAGGAVCAEGTAGDRDATPRRAYTKTDTVCINFIVQAAYK
jgi:hypothetical protein